MAEPPILVVDENDRPVGSAPFKELIEKGLLHRVVHVIVEDKDGRLLLQKRGKAVGSEPDHWDFSVGGHVDEGESYLQAAKREMQEELGLTGFELKKIDYFRNDRFLGEHQRHRFNEVYKTVVPADATITSPPDEVAATAWFNVDQIKSMIKKGGELVTEDFKQAIDKYYS